MKLNIAYPVTGCQKLLDIDDDRKLRPFMEKRIAQEVDASCLGNEWKGYTLRITGGNDKQGFPMMQGVLTNQRVRLLLDKRHKCYRQRRKGERKRKSVRGCIVDGNLSVVACVITKRGEQDIDGLTNKTIPRRLGPKRANHIRKLFNLSKEDDVRKYVVKRPLTKESKKPRVKAPKIQRLITPRRIQRKRHSLALKKRRAEKQRVLQNEYAKLLQQYSKEKRERKRSESKRRSSTRLSESKPFRLKLNMRFRFCGGEDCADWILAEIFTLSKLSSVKLKLLCQQVMQAILTDNLNFSEAQKLVGDKFESGDLKASIRALQYILTMSAKHSVDGQSLLNELIQLGLPKENATALVKVYDENFDKLIDKLRSSVMRLTTMNDIQWNMFDVKTTNNIHDMHLPVVTMNLNYDDNIENKSKSISFSLNAEQFAVLFADLQAARDLIKTYSKS